MKIIQKEFTIFASGKANNNTKFLTTMKRIFTFSMWLVALFVLLCQPMQAEMLLLTEGSDITASSSADGLRNETDSIDPKANINLLFIGNSITAGATLSNASTQAPPILCRSLIEQATGVTTNVYNGGHSGITTWGYLPGRNDFTRIVNNATTFRKANGGLIYFSIMLGTNDSACTRTEGAPVSPDTYRDNIKKIIDKLIAEVPGCKILLNYPIWYSPSTYNGAKYLQEGLDRLHSYYPVLDAVVEEYGQVYAGNRGVWEYFENNVALFTRESGNAGDFFLHPNLTGATRLAEIWAKSLLEIIEGDGIKVKHPLPEQECLQASE